MNNELSKLNDDYQKGSNSIEELKKKLEDLDEQLKNEESTKLNFITPAIQKKWNAEGDRIVMEYGKRGSGHFLYVSLDDRLG